MINLINPILEKTIFYNNEKWKLSFILDKDSITLHLEKENEHIYESNFKLKDLRKYKIFSLTNTIKSVLELIDILIKKNQFKIEEKEIFCVLSFVPSYDKIFDFKIYKQIKSQNELINNQKNVDLNKLHLKKIKTIKAHNNGISNLDIFPSGNFISASFDRKIKIWDKDLNLIQSINNAHDDGIFHLNIKDEDNFISASLDCYIKIWVKKENKYALKQTIINAHKSRINKVLYVSFNIIISCSTDKTIKIWEKINTKYQIALNLFHSESVENILLIEKKNILISSGEDGTKLWNYNNYECIHYFPEAKCVRANTIALIDNETFIVGGIYDNLMSVISIPEKKIINIIDNKFSCFGILVLNDKGIILSYGRSDDMRIYRIDDFSFIKMFLNIHNNDINCVIRLNNSSIVTCSCEKKIKKWVFSQKNQKLKIISSKKLLFPKKALINQK